MKRDTFENINPRGFIVSSIHRECFESVITDRTIPTERNKPIYTCSLIDTPGDTELDIVEFDEIMELIAESDLEREVIDLRRNGFEDREIAEILDISRFAVSRLRSTLYERFNHVK